MSTTESPPPPVPADVIKSSGSERPQSARAIVWFRRRAAFGAFCRSYAKHTSGVIGLVVLLAIILATVLAPLYTDRADLNAATAPGGRMESPSGEFWLGTDRTGRPILTMIVWGARVSLQIGLTAAVIAVAFGTVVGMVAAHYGGWLSWLLMRVTDWFIVLPAFILSIALVVALGSASKWVIITAIALNSWATTARLVRAQTLSIEGRPYLERTRALGAGDWHQMTRHVLPNLMPLVLASATLRVSAAILSEASLAFIGLGDPRSFSWGIILARAQAEGAVSYGAWWYVLPPGLAILALVLSFTLIGRTMESVLNPRLRDDR
ncbi:Glutathione transport system permease protein GsiD [Streptomyces sp. RB5]|uniref:Glutathione transport system permease protein GsiD n=1 Tax=Streptomyces smaragdinus TaxID=2585196 RepID=A0A7K0CTP3_9ACTN|nr:ABC transporter permease [Streptomyces smaragdinus]MQY16856.1 Glutathione transport system permease protein GsiD [Streptomyces smaragdinus]